MRNWEANNIDVENVFVHTKGVYKLDYGYELFCPAHIIEDKGVELEGNKVIKTL